MSGKPFSTQPASATPAPWEWLKVALLAIGCGLTVAAVLGFGHLLTLIA